MIKSLRISVCFVLSLFGLLALTGFYCVSDILSHMEFTSAALWALVLFVVCFVAAWLAVYAKTTRSDSNFWFRMEILLVALMFGVSGYMAFRAVPGLTFFLETRELRELAKTDVQAMAADIDRFDTHEHSTLEVTLTGLRNLLRYHGENYGNVDPEVKAFVRNDVMRGGAVYNLNGDMINIYGERKEAQIEALSLDPNLNVRMQIDDRMDLCSSIINSWDPTGVSDLPDSLASLSSFVATTLTSLSANMNLPIIESNDSSFSLSPVSGTVYAMVQPEFSAAYTDLFSYSNIAAIALTVVFILLYVLNYFMCVREIDITARREVKISDEHGLPL